MYHQVIAMALEQNKNAWQVAIDDGIEFTFYSALWVWIHSDDVTFYSL
jgi:hypothetical protein